MNPVAGYVSLRLSSCPLVLVFCIDQRNTRDTSRLIFTLSLFYAILDVLETDHQGVVMATVGIIAGMHRSGTSALARVMNLLGYDIPGEIDTNTHHNASGHWEPVAFVALNMHILAELGSDWCELRLPEATAIDTISDQTRTAINEYADASFGAHDTIVIKDPRVCYTLPLWLDAVRRRGDTALVLLPYRHPVEVAKSLAARDGMELNIGLALWLCSMLSAEFYSRGTPRCAVGFGAFIADWRAAYVPVAALTGSTIPDRTDPVGMQIDRYVNREQRHHTILELTPALRALSMLDLALEAYQLFDAELDTPAVRNQFDTLRQRVVAQLAADGLVTAARDFGRTYKHLRAIDEREQVIATLRREMHENNLVAQQIADERESLKVYQTDLIYRHRIIQQRQAEHIEELGHTRLRQKERISELTHEVAWREGQLQSAITERDWLRDTESAREREVVWLRAVVASQEHLLWPIRPLLRLWQRILRRSSDTHPNE